MPRSLLEQSIYYYATKCNTVHGKKCAVIKECDNIEVFTGDVLLMDFRYSKQIYMRYVPMFSEPQPILLFGMSKLRNKTYEIRRCKGTGEDSRYKLIDSFDDLYIMEFNEFVFGHLSNIEKMPITRQIRRPIVNS